MNASGLMPGITHAPPPRSFSAGRPSGPPRFIVIHYTAGAEGRTAAEDGAAYDRRRTDGTSCHFFTDPDSIVQEVSTNDRAHAAKFNGNLWGIQVEQCGTAQTRAQWLDGNSRAMITNTARVCAWAMAEYGIPLVRLTGSQVRSGRGLCGHGDITIGFPEDNGTHTDPGPEYPWDVLFDDIRAINSGQLEGNDVNLGDQNPIGDLAASYKAAGSTPKDADTVGRLLNLGPLRGLEAAKAARDEGVKTRQDLGNHFLGLVDDLASLEGGLKALAGKVDQLQAGGVDLDALADKLADKLAARLAT